MKGTGRAVLAFLAMLVMLAAAFAIGSYRGYLNEKLNVEMASGSLDEVLDARIEMGNNLLTVASRHVSQDDPLLVSIQKQLHALKGEGSISEKSAANEVLGQDGKALLTQLESLPSVQNDARDLRYVTGLLPRGFEQSEQWADAQNYNAAAAAFNDRLNGTINGYVARLLGIQPAELFEGGQGQ